jgi:hypothetical protein
MSWKWWLMGGDIWLATLNFCFVVIVSGDHFLVVVLLSDGHFSGTRKISVATRAFPFVLSAFFIGGKVWRKDNNGGLHDVLLQSTSKGYFVQCVGNPTSWSSTGIWIGIKTFGENNTIYFARKGDLLSFQEGIRVEQDEIAYGKQRSTHRFEN